MQRILLNKLISSCNTKTTKYFRYMLDNYTHEDVYLTCAYSIYTLGPGKCPSLLLPTDREELVLHTKKSLVLDDFRLNLN